MKNEKKSQLNTSLFKGIIGGTPYFGTLLNEIFFDYRGRLKQERVNNFINSIEVFIKNSTCDEYDLDKICTEDFIDVFDAVIKYVVITKSTKKLELFKRILLNQLLKETKNIVDFDEVYLEIIHKMSSNEIILLKQLDEMNSIYCSLKDDQQNENLKEYEIEDKIYSNYYNVTEKFRKPEYYNMSKIEYEFSLQKLLVLGLVRDDGIGRIGYEPFHNIEITEFGMNFINFIGN